MFIYLILAAFCAALAAPLYLTSQSWLIAMRAALLWQVSTSTRIPKTIPSVSNIRKGVRRFVSRMGTQIDYSVVVDGPTRPLARTWMQAGDYQGMPTTFVVDQTGHMVWAGYPPGLESVLARVLAGNFTNT